MTPEAHTTPFHFIDRDNVYRPVPDQMLEQRVTSLRKSIKLIDGAGGDSANYRQMVSDIEAELTRRQS